MLLKFWVFTGLASSFAFAIFIWWILTWSKILLAIKLESNLLNALKDTIKKYSSMIYRIVPFVLFLFVGCTTASKKAKIKNIAEDNKDVVVLSYLIRNYMRKTKSSSFTFADIVKNDTLGRITKNFSSVEVSDWSNLWRGGYAVYFKFSDNRNQDTIKLMHYERIPWKVKMKKKIGRNKSQLVEKYDGEIHFYYPERFYHITGILIKNPRH